MEVVPFLSRMAHSARDAQLGTVLDLADDSLTRLQPPGPAPNVHGPQGERWLRVPVTAVDVGFARDLELPLRRLHRALHGFESVRRHRRPRRGCPPTRHTRRWPSVGPQLRDAVPAGDHESDQDDEAAEQAADLLGASPGSGSRVHGVPWLASLDASKPTPSPSTPGSVSSGKEGRT